MDWKIVIMICTETEGCVSQLEMILNLIQKKGLDKMIRIVLKFLEQTIINLTITLEVNGY